MAKSKDVITQIRKAIGRKFSADEKIRRIERQSLSDDVPVFVPLIYVREYPAGKVLSS